MSLETLRRGSRTRWRVAVLLLAVLTALGLRLLGANMAQSQTAEVKVWRMDRDPGLDPAAKAWSKIPAVQVPLTAQQVVYPFGGGSIPAISAQAAETGDRLYLRLEWADGTEDVTTDQTQLFADAVAVEFPSTPAATVPSVCMGQADQGVNIWQWRADSQPDLAATAPAHTPYVDLYPSEGDLWFPARAAGNPYDRQTRNPVQDLVARSFGTLGPTQEQQVTGRGAYADGHWTVVLSRTFASPGQDQPAFGQGEVIDVAFAAWNGSHGDRNGKKQVSQFVRLAFGSARTPPPPVTSGFPYWPAPFFLFLGAWVLFGWMLLREPVSWRRPAS